jgi:hypothetical protein
VLAVEKKVELSREQPASVVMVRTPDNAYRGPMPEKGIFGDLKNYKFPGFLHRTFFNFGVENGKEFPPFAQFGQFRTIRQIPTLRQPCREVETQVLANFRGFGM